MCFLCGKNFMFALSYMLLNDIFISITLPDDNIYQALYVHVGFSDLGPPSGLPRGVSVYIVNITYW